MTTTSVEYDDIYKSAMQNTIYNNDDEYTALMNKEQVVLDTVNRVVNQVETAKQNQKSMVDTPVNVVVYRVFNTITTVFKEIYERKPLGQVLREERRLYVGLFVVFCSVCFIVLYKLETVILWR